MSISRVYSLKTEGPGMREICSAGEKGLVDIVSQMLAPVGIDELVLLAQKQQKNVARVGVTLGGRQVQAIKEDAFDVMGNIRTYFTVPEKDAPGLSVYLAMGAPEPQKLCTLVGEQFSQEVWQGDNLNPAFVAIVRDKGKILVDGENADKTITSFKYTNMDGGRIIESTPVIDRTPLRPGEVPLLSPFKAQVRLYDLTGKRISEKTPGE